MMSPKQTIPLKLLDTLNPTLNSTMIRSHVGHTSSPVAKMHIRVVLVLTITSVWNGLSVWSFGVDCYDSSPTQWLVAFATATEPKREGVPMLERNYDPKLPYRYVRYGRMSSDRQNKRSPEQQFDTIDETIKRLGYPWIPVQTYRDDGVSGQYVKRRLGFQGMLRDIETGVVVGDLIAVDTLERLGRAEEIAFIRHKLFVNHGVLVVAADNNYADPTGVVGKAVGVIEQIRSTENTRISGHNVKRGKKDAVRRNRWPGGDASFGFELLRHMDETVRPPQVYSTLVPEPRAAGVLQLLFQRAAETGHGTTRLAKWWNGCPDIPEEFKPISPSTIGYRLWNPICIGTLLWGVNQTGVVNDMRVVERNPNGPEVIPGFCDPIIDPELFRQVEKLCEVRSQHAQARKKKNKSAAPEKLIAPQSRGMSLKYALSGIVRCGCCRSSMRAIPSGRTSKGGAPLRLLQLSTPHGRRVLQQPPHSGRRVAGSRDRTPAGSLVSSAVQ